MKLALVAVIINSLVCNRDCGIDDYSPASRSLQIGCPVVAALPSFVIAESTADVGHLDALCSVSVVIGMRRETIRNGA